MPAPLRLGLAGLGTVGIGVVKIVQKHADLIAARAGRPVTITAVSARDRTKNRDADLSAYAWETDPVALARRPDIDVFVEVMGGHEGPAKLATEAAIAAGKDVVTANKALLAHHGQALAETAEAAGRVIRFEAAVAGGIPVIKALTEGLAANQMRRVMGVMNGTCNYILTRMQNAGLPYETVFEEARQLGYLEADPNLDVGGIDAGHKLSLLAAIAFGTKVSFDKVELEGIGNVSIEDIRMADDMGYHIKLLGVAQMTGRGLEQRMTPCLVPAESPLGQLQGGTNMVVLEGDSVGQIVLRRLCRHGRCDRHRARLPPAHLRPPRRDTRGPHRRPLGHARALLPAHDAARQTRCIGQGRDLHRRVGHLHRPDAPDQPTRRGRRQGHRPDRHPQGRPRRHRACAVHLPRDRGGHGHPRGDPDRGSVTKSNL